MMTPSATVLSTPKADSQPQSKRSRPTRTRAKSDYSRTASTDEVKRFKAAQSFSEVLAPTDINVDKMAATRNSIFVSTSALPRSENDESSPTPKTGLRSYFGDLGRRCMSPISNYARSCEGYCREKTPKHGEDGHPQVVSSLDYV